MITLVRPSRGPTTQRFGNIQPDGNPHAGQDSGYSEGVEIFPEVYAAADGMVLFAGDSRGLGWPNLMYLNIDFDRTDNVDTSAGNYIIIGHYVNGVLVALTGYGHLEEVWVKTGDTVRASQRIAVCGETGFSAGKHLHFDFILAPFRVNIAPYYGRVDPEPYFAGSLSYQGGTITPLEEIDMAAAADILARLTEIVEWQNTKFKEAEAVAESNRNALAGFVRDVVNAKGSITDAEIDAKFAELAAAGKTSSGTLFKGDNSDTVYAWDAATGFRGLHWDEYLVLVTGGSVLSILPQAIIDNAVGGK